MVIGKPIGEIQVGKKVFVWLRGQPAENQQAKQEQKGLFEHHILSSRYNKYRVYPSKEDTLFKLQMAKNTP